MLYSKKHFRDRIEKLLDTHFYEDACFVIQNGLALHDEVGEFLVEYDDNELIGIMERL